MRNFRLLKADEIECRISQVKDNGVAVLLYKTARTDYSLLDETIGLMKWQNKYEVIDGKMYCGIGIKDDGGEWVWKWNCGTESNTEAEKGQASDAMKRAGFAWGIGTELYSAPFIWIDNEHLEKRNGKNVYDKFYVREIGYNEAQDIAKLVIVNHGGRTVFEFPRSAQNAPQAQKAYTPKTTPPTQRNAPTNAPDGEFVPTCKDCGTQISEKVHDYSVKKFGVPLCMNCQKNHANR